MSGLPKVDLRPMRGVSKSKQLRDLRTDFAEALAIIHQMRAALLATSDALKTGTGAGRALELSSDILAIIDRKLTIAPPLAHMN